MKKYLFTSAAALAFCGLFTSCTHDLGSEGSSAQNSVVKTYEQAFVTAFGQPDPNQEWGFGTSVKAATRGTRAMPNQPDFGTNVISAPSNPSAGKTFYNTVSEAQAAGITVNDATNQQNYRVYSDNSYAINGSTSLSELGNCSNVTLYITDNMNFNLGLNQNSNTNIVITKDKTVTFTPNQNQTIYVAEGATLNIPNDFSVERNFYLVMGNGSTVNAQDIHIKSGSYIVNNGGTLNLGTQQNKKSLKLENGCTLWNAGTVNAYQDLRTVNDNGIIYNAPNSTITTSLIYLIKYVKLYNEGTITSTSGLTCENEGNQIKNTSTATITLPSLTLSNNNELFINEGRAVISGTIKVHNSNPKLLNSGYLEGGSLEVGAGGWVHNETDGVVLIKGSTVVDNTNSHWMNDGKYTSGHFEIKASAYDVWNNCKLTVTTNGTNGDGAFHLNRGTFVLNGGGALITDYFYWEDTSNFYLGGNALVDIKEELNTRNYNSNYAFRGESDNYSVIRAKKISKHADVQFSLSFFGNIYLECDDMFPQGYIDTSHMQPYYHLDSTVKYGKEEDCPFKIEGSEDGCNPGYGKDPEPDPSSDIIRVICEDLSVKESTDWDFNDAVFDVQLLDNNSKVKITLLAAGGTLPLTVAGEEVHGKFQEFNPNLGISTGTMLSTGSTNSTNKYHYINCVAPYYIIDNIYGSTDIKEVAKNIPVQVQKLVNDVKTWVTLECEKGKATAKVAVRDNYNWCDEREHINSRYTLTDMRGNEYGGFTLYTEGIVGDADDPDGCWYNYNGPITDEMVQEHLGQ